jgi:hypothetical protein
MATADKYGYRKYLNEKGVKDEDITYDNGTVKVKGQFFGNATPEADGSTYSTKGNLDALYNNYRTQSMPTNQGRADTLLNTVQERLNQPRTPFQYNPQSDPQYQSALQSAQQAATTQQGNTLARLRAMGQGKSSYSEGVANQIGQQAVADVNAKVLPQLMAQSYQRYIDEQNMGRQNVLDLLGLGREYNNLNQQGLDNTFRQEQADRDSAYRDQAFTEQRRQNNLDAAFRVGQQIGRVIQPKEDYSLLFNQDDAPLNLQGQQVQYQQYRDQIADEQYKQKFDEDVRRFGLEQALREAAQANQFANAAADNARANAQLGLQRERFDFEKEQTNKQKEQTPSQTQQNNEFVGEVTTNLDRIPADKRVQFFRDEKQTLINQLGLNGYNQLYNLYFNSDGSPK